MTESDVIAGTSGGPVTQMELETGLRALGLGTGHTILAHSSLSRLGWVVGGGQAVLFALEAVLGSEGTLMMPAFFDGAPEPSRWRDPPVPESWWPTIREAMPPWDPTVSPTRQVGIVADILRHQPRTVQSFHPNKSFVARGPEARGLIEGHLLDDGFGEGSPLARLYDLDGKILLLGVGHQNNTSLHLAESRANWYGRQHPLQLTGRVVREGRVESVSFRDIDGTSDDFNRLGTEYERRGGPIGIGPVGRGISRLIPMRPIVDFAVEWIERNRQAGPRPS